MTTQVATKRAFQVLAAATVLFGAPFVQAQPCTMGPRAVPTRWFQETFSVTTATPMVTGDDTRTKDTSEARRRLFQVPPNRFAVIESIAVKGTHPQDGYLAIELTTIGWAATSDTARTFARHFLYNKQRPDAGNSEVHIRESLSGVAAAPGSYVALGIQLSKADTTALKHDPFIVTVTGTFYSCQ
jgi:hypothetical protein